MKKITFILHGKHLRKHKIQYEAEKYLGKEFSTDFYITKLGRATSELAQKVVESGTDYLIAVGGDGTINEVVNGIMTVPKEKRENLIIGLLPFGSGNDFARTMNLSTKVHDLIELIKNSKIQPIDIGKLDCKSIDDKDKTYYFINIADTGLGAEVAKRVNEGHKKYGPNYAFFSATIKSFFNYSPKKIKLTSSTFNYEGNVLILCFANAKYFGSGLGIAPHAKIDDGKMAITLAGNVSLFDYLKNVMTIRKCVKVNHPQITYGEADTCTIEPIGEPSLIEADGEMIGKVPLKVTMLHKELLFLTNV